MQKQRDAQRRRLRAGAEDQPPPRSFSWVKPGWFGPGLGCFTPGHPESPLRSSNRESKFKEPFVLGSLSQTEGWTPLLSNTFLGRINPTFLSRMPWVEKPVKTVDFCKCHTAFLMPHTKQFSSKLQGCATSQKILVPTGFHSNVHYADKRVRSSWPYLHTKDLQFLFCPLISCGDWNSFKLCPIVLDSASEPPFSAALG